MVSHRPPGKSPLAFVAIQHQKMRLVTFVRFYILVKLSDGLWRTFDALHKMMLNVEQKACHLMNVVETAGLIQ